MGKRLGILGAVTVVVALMVGAVSPALGSSSGASADIDLGAPGFSLGDTVVFGGVLQRPDGTPVGRYGLVCTFVSAANPAHVEAQCPTTATLPGGQITTQGIVVNRALNTTLPITGGSGQFQGAGGQMVQRDISSGGQLKLELTFHLKF